MYTCDLTRQDSLLLGNTSKLKATQAIQRAVWTLLAQRHLVQGLPHRQQLRILLSSALHDHLLTPPAGCMSCSPSLAAEPDATPLRPCPPVGLRVQPTQAAAHSLGSSCLTVLSQCPRVRPAVRPGRNTNHPVTFTAYLRHRS